MGHTFLRIGPAAIAAIALLTLGGCVPPLEPPPSAGTTVSPSITALGITTSMMHSELKRFPTGVQFLPSSEERIEMALDAPISTPFVGRSLFDLAAYFRRSCSVNLTVDQVALNKESIDGGLPVNVTLSDVSLACLLDAMLEPTDLTWTIRNETLTITTKEVAAGIRVLKAHDITELVSRPECSDAETGRCQALIAVIAEHFAPANPNHPTSIKAVPAGNGTALVFSHEYRVHRQIEQLLDELQAIARQHATRS